ncbi:hypothetical protein L209DRAFT_757494 [Thermothelomyces heterothallicus CBS 203.75]
MLPSPFRAYDAESVGDEGDEGRDNHRLNQAGFRQFHPRPCLLHHKPPNRDRQSRVLL